MLLKVGAFVRCLNGTAGKLKSVVVNPEDNQVTHLIVAHGMLKKKERIVPVAWVEYATENEILLNATLEELETLPEFEDLFFVVPEVEIKLAEGYQPGEIRTFKNPYASTGGGNAYIARFVRFGFHDDEVLLQRGTPVLVREEKEVGTVDHLVVDPKTNLVTHLVVRRGGLVNREARIISIERVHRVKEAGVRLDMTAEEFEQAPLFEPPASDEQIAFSLQRALDTDPSTRGSGLRVDVQNGVVSFIGSVTDEVKKAARAIASRIRGVIGFSEDVLAPPSPPLKIGEPVHARDGRYGTLHKVVVDPYERRVTHLVVRHGWLLAKDRVIPIERVEHVELDGVYLDAEAAELDVYPQYREEVFAEPLLGWAALEPYKYTDTLFWGGLYTGVAPPILPVIEHVVPVGVPEDKILMRRGANVFFDGKVVGVLDHMLVDPTSGAMTHLIVEEYDSGRRVIVPTEWVRELDGEVIVLDRWEPEHLGVPSLQARDDAEISADLHARFQATPGLSGVQVEVERGVAHLSGHVPTSADRDAAEAIARGTPGVVAVENMLIQGVNSPQSTERDRSEKEQPGWKSLPVREELIDESLEETFPASDPPSPFSNQDQVH